jgi:hypothetical protein
MMKFLDECIYIVFSTVDIGHVAGMFQGQWGINVAVLEGCVARLKGHVAG